MALSGVVPAAQWSPPARLVALGWVAFVAAVGWCAATWADPGDAPGRLLSSVAAVVLGSAALFATRARPRLRADADGVTVGGLVRARRVPWPQVIGVRVAAVRRLGINGSLLEIDTRDPDGDEALIVFGRLDLGVDPVEVAAQLIRLRPDPAP